MTSSVRPNPRVAPSRPRREASRDSLSEFPWRPDRHRPGSASTGALGGEPPWPTSIHSPQNCQRAAIVSKIVVFPLPLPPCRSNRFRAGSGRAFPSPGMSLLSGLTSRKQRRLMNMD